MSDAGDPSRPRPKITPETRRYWEEAAEGRLLLRECRECGLVFHYPRALCPDCFGETDWREATGNGTVYSYSVTRRIEGWPAEDLPLIVAYVELEEGPRLLTNLECEPDAVSIGTSVEVRFRDQGPETTVPVFVPVDD